MSFWICSLLVAEAKKAEGASIATVRIPRPPSLIGRVACVHWSFYYYYYYYYYYYFVFAHQHGVYRLENCQFRKIVYLQWHSQVKQIFNYVFFYSVGKMFWKATVFTL